MQIKGFPLQLSGRQIISLPAGAEILTVVRKADQIYLLTVMVEDAPFEDRTFAVYQVEQSLPQSIGHYIATVQDQAGYCFIVCELRQPR
jgi:hypothetical protein